MSLKNRVGWQMTYLRMEVLGTVLECAMDNFERYGYRHFLVLFLIV